MKKRILEDQDFVTFLMALLMLLTILLIGIFSIALMNYLNWI